MPRTFEEILRDLSDVDQPLPAEAIYRLSDLNEEGIKSLQTFWGKIPTDRRLTLVQRLSEAAETNFDMDFTAGTRGALAGLGAGSTWAAVRPSWIELTSHIARRTFATPSMRK